MIDSAFELQNTGVKKTFSLGSLRQTVMLWCQPVQTGKEKLRRPVKQICGFAQSPLLEPGHSFTVEISVTPDTPSHRGQTSLHF
jgi:hypothetical protein